MNQSNNPLTDPSVIEEIARNDNVSSKILTHIFTSKSGESKEIFYYLYPNEDLNNPLDFELGKKHLNKKIINVYQDIEVLLYTLRLQLLIQIFPMKFVI